MHHFNRSVKAGRIRAALNQLRRDGWARAEERKTGKPGPAEERWFASSRLIVRNYSSPLVREKENHYGV